MVNLLNIREGTMDGLYEVRNDSLIPGSILCCSTDSATPAVIPVVEPSDGCSVRIKD